MAERFTHVLDCVDSYFHDALDPGEKSYVEEHCARCNVCRTALEEAEKRYLVVRDITYDEPGDELLAATLQSIDRYETNQRTRRRVLRHALLYGMAAMIVAFLGAALYRTSLTRSPYDLRVLASTHWYADSDASLRVLLVRHDERTPAVNVPVRIELADKDGVAFTNLASFMTDMHGSGQVTFHVPDWKEGDYQLRVTAEPDGTPQVITQAVHLRQAQKYALPRFRTNVTLARDVFLPGQSVEGKVQTACFFGKPVDGARIELDLRPSWNPNQPPVHMDLITDETGEVRFAFPTSATQALDPGEPGARSLDLFVSVIDVAGQKQTLHVPVPVSRERSSIAPSK